MWCVIRGFDYEGEDFSSLRLFAREVDARAYEELLKAEEPRLFYVLCEFRDVM